MKRKTLHDFWANTTNSAKERKTGELAEFSELLKKTVKSSK